MTCREELIAYAQDCISGKIISGQKHIWACQRLLNDFNRIGSDDFPYEWNEEEAQKFVEGQSA